MMQFTCSNGRCGSNGSVIEMDSEQVRSEGDQPRCPFCGDRDSFISIKVRVFQEYLNKNFAPDTDKNGRRPGDVDLEPGVPCNLQTPSTTFTVKDSGKREEFSTGARRDTQDGKGDFSRVPMTWLLDLAKELQRRNEATDRIDLLPISPLLRLASVYGKGAAKYNDGNYKAGIPISRCMSSAMRHLIAYAAGDTSEDHLAQAAWNAFAMIFMDEGVRAGTLPAEIGDYGPLAKPNCRTKFDIPIWTAPDHMAKDTQTILAVKAGCELRAFFPADEKTGTVKVIWQRGGSYLTGWVAASLLEMLPLPQGKMGYVLPNCSNTTGKADVELCSNGCDTHMWFGSCVKCNRQMELTMRLVHQQGAVCSNCKSPGTLVQWSGDRS